MAIASKDFVPATNRSGIFTIDYEPHASVVARANEWMVRIGARVVNVETILLPNITSESQAGQNDLRTSGDISSHWLQVVRVWYDVPEAPTAEPGAGSLT
jgi:hypothetical protein